MSEAGDKFDRVIEAIEHLFYSVEVRAIVRNEARQEQGDEVLQLRAQLERVQGLRLDAPVLPVHPALAALLPGGGLRPGAAYSLGRSTSLLLALLAQPSQDGSWCGVIGMPELGAEAAEAIGVDLSRLVLIPDPGRRWLAVTATIAEVLPVVAVRPPARAGDAEMARLARAAARSRRGAARAGAVAAGRGDARRGRSAVVGRGARSRLSRRAHRDRDGVEQAVADARGDSGCCCPAPAARSRSRPRPAGSPP